MKRLWMDFLSLTGRTPTPRPPSPVVCGGLDPRTAPDDGRTDHPRFSKGEHSSPSDVGDGRMRGGDGVGDSVEGNRNIGPASWEIFVPESG